MKSFVSRLALAALVACSVTPALAQSIRGEATRGPRAITATWDQIVAHDGLNRMRRVPKAIKNKFGKFMDLRVPAGAKIAEGPIAAPPFMVDEPAPQSPPPVRTFEGIRDNSTYIPPDTNGAVGTTHVVTAVNGTVRIHQRDGTPVSTVTLDSFFSPTGFGNTFDPRTRWDPVSGRWVMVACANGGSANSRVLLAVSQTANPTGSWNFYALSPRATNAWSDYPSVGINKDWIVINLNEFGIGGGFSQGTVYAVSKTSVYSGGAIASTGFDLTSVGGTHSPSTHYNNTDSTVYFLNQGWQDGNGVQYLRLFTLTGAVGQETFTTTNTFYTFNPEYNGGGINDFAPQLGSAQLIANNDSRIQNVVFRNGSIYATQTRFVPRAARARAVVVWFQLDPAGTVTQVGQIGGEASDFFYAFPSIAVNSLGDVLVGYSRYSAGQYAGSNYGYRRAGDPAGTLRSDFEYKAGLASYYKTYGGPANRWGDYSSTEVDPVDDTTFYTVQEYAETPSNNWGTYWAVVAPPATTPVWTDIRAFRTTGTRTLGYWATTSGTVTSWKSVGTVAAGWDPVGGGDVNGDSIEDFPLFRSSDGSLGFWRWNGTAITGWTGLSSRVAAGWAPVGFGDVDGDSDMDVLLFRSSDRRLGAWRMTGSTISGWVTIGTLAAGWVPVGLHDANNDGRLDAMMLRASDGSVGGWTLSGAAVISGWRSISTRVPAGWTFTGWGDMNGDGKNDMLVTQTSTRRVGAYLLNGNVVTGWRGSIVTVGSGWNTVGVGNH